MSQTRLYIGGLDPKCREGDLERFFAGYGRLKSILLKRGYAFVEFEDSHDATDAVDSLNGTEMLGHKVQIAHATPRSFRSRPPMNSYRGGRGRGGGRGRFGDGYSRGRASSYGGGYNSTRQIKRGSGYRVIVKNLSSRVTWQVLKDFMRQAGEVSYADVCADLNEGTVEYRFYADYRRALETLDNAELGGWKIRLVDEDKGGYPSSSSSSKDNYRSNGYSGGGGGRSWRDRSFSRTRSRSRSRSPIRSRKW